MARHLPETSWGHEKRKIMVTSDQALRNYMLFLLGFMSGVSGGEGSRHVNVGDWGIFSTHPPCQHVSMEILAGSWMPRMPKEPWQQCGFLGGALGWYSMHLREVVAQSLTAVPGSIWVSSWMGLSALWPLLNWMMTGIRNPHAKDSLLGVECSSSWPLVLLVASTGGSCKPLAHENLKGGWLRNTMNKMHLND